MRSSAAATLLAALLLAGCLGAAGPAPPYKPPTGGNDPFLGVRALVDAGRGLWEPSLGVTREGVLFSGSFGRHADGSVGGAVYRSVDGGATWEGLGDPLAEVGNADPQLAVDADGAVWFSALWVGCVGVAVSRDLGESWSANPAACTGAVGDRQNLVPTKGGHAILDWQQFPTKWHVSSLTHDHGATWRPGGLVEPPDHHPALTGEVSGWGGSGFWSPATGDAFVTFSWFTRQGSPTSNEYAWSPAFSVTHDLGRSWALHRLPTRDAAFQGVSPVVGAADEAGGVYLAWAETAAEGEGRVQLAVSAGDPALWRDALRVDLPGEGGSRTMPAIAAGGPGEVALAWLETTAPGDPKEVPADAEWRVHLAWSRDAQRDRPTFRHATLDGPPAKGGPLCLDGLSCAEGRELGEYFSLRRLPDGRLGVLWTSTEENPDGPPALVYAATAEPLLSPWA